MGALALLAIVAALMYLTRKVDWYTAVPAPTLS
jgi:inner membrane protein involved in colicin E2 resistance